MDKTSPEKKVWILDLTADDDGDGGYIEYRVKVSTGGSKKRTVLIENDNREAQILKIDGEDVMEEWFAQLDELPYLPSDSPLHESLLNDDDEEEYSALQRSPHLPGVDFSTDSSYEDESVVMTIPHRPHVLPPLCPNCQQQHNTHVELLKCCDDYTPSCARRLNFERNPPSTPPPQTDFIDPRDWAFDETDWPHVENLEKEIDNPSTLVHRSQYPSPC